MRYFLEISYDGNDFHGWQVQKNAHSLQQEMNTALSKLLPEDIRCMGCGRTDTAVHAKQFFLHFDTEKKDVSQLVYRLNKMLPKSIAAHRLIEVAPNAHTRFDAREREYVYYIHFTKNPFLAQQSFHYFLDPLDIKLMQQAADLLINYKSFESLCRKDPDANNYLCDVRYARWEILENGQWRFTIRANRFLRSMVRKIVGSLIMIGRGKMDIATFDKTIKARQPFKYIMPVQGYGLYLSRVTYPYID